jgi:hypothetical protein
VTQKQMPSQREQYGRTVHLFIGTGRRPCKITLVPFTFANDSLVIHRGLKDSICLEILLMILRALKESLSCDWLRLKALETCIQHVLELLP